MALWQVYRSHQITALKVPGFQLCKSTAYETEIKLLGAEFSESLNQKTQPAVSFASVREFATLAAPDWSICAAHAHLFLPLFLSWYFSPTGDLTLLRVLGGCLWVCHIYRHAV